MEYLFNTDYKSWAYNLYIYNKKGTKINSIGEKHLSYMHMATEVMAKIALYY